MVVSVLALGCAIGPGKVDSGATTESDGESSVDGEVNPTTTTTTAGDGDGDSTSTGTNDDDESPCGNGVIDPGEQCDGTDFDGFTCKALGYDGGTLGCDPIQCIFDTSGCGEKLVCGNGMIDRGEHCDGDNLNGFTCTDLGYASGNLACDPITCTFDASGCIAGPADDGSPGTTG